MLTFSQWLAANKYDEAALTPEMRKHLEAAWKAEIAAAHPAPALDKPAAESTVDDKLAVFEAEAKRKDFIRESCEKWAAENTHAGTEKFKQLRALQEAAMADPKTDRNAFQLAMLRFDRTVGMMVLTPRQTEASPEIIEAALCVAGGLENIEKHYKDQTLEASRRQYKNGVGLQAAIGECARANGWRGHDVKANWFQATRAAFRANGDGGEMYSAVTGPSTYSLPNIFSNVGNKFMREGFMAVENSWREFAEITRFNDFKQKTELGLTGSMLYNELPPSGEIKHTTLGEITYTNRAKTYAVMLGLDRQSIVNDDLGVLTGASRRMGRGYALTLNNLVYTTFINNSTFFTSGNNNVITGATSVLSGATGIEALRLAVEKFKLQTDPDGLPLGATPKILLVPASLEIAAKNLMNSTQVIGSTTANSPMPDGNPFAGMFKVVVSPYLQNSSYTGFSATAWYLLSDPSDIPVLEVGFLNGVDSPTVETENAEFNMLGIALRGYFDAGVALKEFRGGVRAAGA